MKFIKLLKYGALMVLCSKVVALDFIFFLTTLWTSRFFEEEKSEEKESKSSAATLSKVMQWVWCTGCWYVSVPLKKESNESKIIYMNFVGFIYSSADYVFLFLKKRDYNCLQCAKYSNLKRNVS